MNEQYNIPKEIKQVIEEITKPENTSNFDWDEYRKRVEPNKQNVDEMFKRWKKLAGL